MCVIELIEGQKEEQTVDTWERDRFVPCPDI